MPLISSFYGILICMCLFDAEQNRFVHIHAQYQGQEAQYAIGGSAAGRMASTLAESRHSSEGVHAMNPHVTRLTPQTDYHFLLEFDNGEKRLFDLTPWLDKDVFRALRDSLKFATFWSERGGAATAW